MSCGARLAVAPVTVTGRPRESVADSREQIARSRHRRGHVCEVEQVEIAGHEQVGVRLRSERPRSVQLERVEPAAGSQTMVERRLPC